MNKKQKKMLARIIIAAVLMVALHFVPAAGLVRFGLYMVPYLIIGYDILRKAALGIYNRQVFDENFLMAVATVGAIALGLTGDGDYTEAIAVMLFYQIGEWFQSYAVGKSRRNISDLMDIRRTTPTSRWTAGWNRWTRTRWRWAPSSSSSRGEGADRRHRRAGLLDAGYRRPHRGERAPGGGRRGRDHLRLHQPVRPAAHPHHQGVRRIHRLQDSGPGGERLLPQEPRRGLYLPVCPGVYPGGVLFGAGAGGAPPLVRQFILSVPADWGTWVYRALTFLVISCPCALVISIPLSFFAGIGGASKEGVLVKGSNYLETLSKTRYVVFDKTGTLTQGVFEVAGIHHSTMDQARLLELAALAESASSHPISKSLQKAHGGELDRSRVGNITEQSGEGVIAEVDGRTVAAGNAKLMRRLGVEYVDCRSVGTVVHVAIDGRYAGHILISDKVKPGSAEAIRALHRAGVKKTIMLTGDAEPVAKEVAGSLGIDEFHAGLLPGDKVAKVEELLAAKDSPKEALAFVGDGINDAPVLSRADIGIAMGAMGSDAAIEAADIVLMDDDPRKIAKAIAISRKCLRIVHQNIVFAIGIKIACLLLTAVGVANMWLGIFADVGVMVLAVLNAIRAMFVKKL